MKLRVHRNILIRLVITLVCLSVFPDSIQGICAAQEPGSAAEYLKETGMSIQEIETLDTDIRQFIADDLRSVGGRNWKMDQDIFALTKTTSQEYTAVFYINVYAFQAETEHRIYVVYESATGIMSGGNDSLFLGVGDRFIPWEYGGRLWYKKAGEGTWIPGGGLAADSKTAEGGTFAGRQLGDFQQKMLVKGCVYCHAGEGTGNDSRVTVEYVYDPPGEDHEAGLYILIIVITVIIVLILRRE